MIDLNVFIYLYIAISKESVETGSYLKNVEVIILCQIELLWKDSIMFNVIVEGLVKQVLVFWSAKFSFLFLYIQKYV